ncbi:methyltransferase, TIGR04325 family [Pseudooceanicola sp.]|uniref:methyltransferase, TIGR04325 family n=1 Tax=Pseudooceanicola sp. TaxID=1914328 RepID=UPI00260F3B61|nr:methyltransferase, TIGR04325 family [Pseudooceanicola sp.]MDF1856196.1 methyltransferase, TIGR04325 family [Pseudooceanicola sp.]
MSGFDSLQSGTAVPQPSALKRAKGVIRSAVHLGQAASARGLALTPRCPRFSGAFASRAQALASLPAARRSGYDDAGIADVSFAQMCERVSWDYPVIFWLERLLADSATLIDAGGHLGTKYIAFSGVLDLSAISWTVYDLPGIVTAARQRQAAGTIPVEISFQSRLEDLPATNLLLASGLLQYLDMPFAALLGALKQPPKHILLNKVALRDGPGLFTIERIGAGRVPYQIRNRGLWEAEIAALGYRISDTWEIRDLGHVIPTHPWLGRSESRGYHLIRNEDPPN